MTIPFTEKFRITRRVIIGPDLSVEIEDVVGGSIFEAELIPPSPRRARPGAPRSGPVWDFRYWKSPIAFYEDSLAAGDRISLQGREWEVISDARTVVVGSQNGVEFTQVLPVDVAYPTIVAVQEVGGEVVQEAVKVAMWSGDQDHRDTGTYTDRNAEAPVEYRSILTPNRQLVTGGMKYKILSSVIDYDEPRMVMEIRKAGMAS